MRKDLPITPENFEKLLGWLDPDRSRAAARYENIRVRLIRVFSCKGCFDAEDLADETFNRVTRKITDLSITIEGGPVSYFYGVASNIYLEWLRERRRFAELQPETADRSDCETANDDEGEQDCLEECLNQLPLEQHSLILDYYRHEKSEKIANRRKLADKLKMSANALQVKVLRMRASLKICVENCVRRKTA